MSEPASATDAAARKADELGVDLDMVEGTGSGGNIIVEDIEKAASTDDGEMSTGSVTLAPADFRLDEFDPNVEGVSPVRREGTPYKTKEEADRVREAAKAAGVDIREVK